MRLAFYGHYYPAATDNTVRTNLTHHDWRHLGSSSQPSGAPVTREEFLTALAAVESLLIKATYHVFQVKVMLQGVSLDTWSWAGEGAPMSHVEVCECPYGYAGTSCEVRFV